MIVSCTQCENTIAIEDERIPPQGMRIRCGRCGEPLVVRGGGEPESLGPPRPSPSALQPTVPFPYEPTPIHSEKVERSQWEAAVPPPPQLTFSGPPPPPSERSGLTAFGAPGSWQEEGGDEEAEEVVIPTQERTLVERTGATAITARRFDPWRGPALLASWLAAPAVAALAAFLVWAGWGWIAGAEEAALRLAPGEVEARIFTDPAGRQAAFVTGRVRVESPLEPGAAIRLQAELVDRDGEVRAKAEGWAGALPPPGGVARFAADREAWADWQEEVARQAPEVEEGSAPFFLLFPQVPEESGSLRARIAARPVTPAPAQVHESSLEIE